MSDCCGNDSNLSASVEISGVTGWTPEYMVLDGVKYVRQAQPPKGYPSWEDWLADQHVFIGREAGEWTVDSYANPGHVQTRHPDYPTALAAAKKEAQNAE